MNRKRKSKRITKHYMVHLRNACWGFRSVNGIVIWAASLGKWMIGKSIDEVESTIKRKGGIIFSEYEQ